MDAIVVTWGVESSSCQFQRLNEVFTLGYQSSNPGMVVLYDVGASAFRISCAMVLCTDLLWRNVE